MEKGRKKERKKERKVNLTDILNINRGREIESKVEAKKKVTKETK